MMNNRTKIILAVITLLSLAALGYVWYQNDQIDQRQTEEMEARVEQTEQPEESEEDLPIETPEEDSGGDGDVLASGTFGRGERDYVGSGSVNVISGLTAPIVQLNDDFSVTNGPDLFVYLSPNSNPISDGLGEFVSLGALQAETGQQSYTGPEDTDDFRSVVIWCRSFEGVFSYATLN